MSVFQIPTRSTVSALHADAGAGSHVFRYNAANGHNSIEPTEPLFWGHPIAEGNERVFAVFDGDAMPSIGSLVEDAALSVVPNDSLSANFWTRGCILHKDGIWNRRTAPYWGRQAPKVAWPVTLYTTDAVPGPTWTEATGVKLSETVGATVNGSATGGDRSNGEIGVQDASDRNFWGFYTRCHLDQGNSGNLGYAKVSLKGYAATSAHPGVQCWVEVWTASASEAGDVAGSEFKLPGTLLATSDKVDADDVVDDHDAHHDFAFSGANQIALSNGGADVMVVFCHDSFGGTSAPDTLHLRYWEKTPATDAQPIHFEEDGSEEWAGAWHPTEWMGTLQSYWHGQNVPHPMPATGALAPFLSLETDYIYQGNNALALAGSLPMVAGTRWELPLFHNGLNSFDWLKFGFINWCAEPDYDPGAGLAIQFDILVVTAGFGWSWESPGSAALGDEPYLSGTWTPSGAGVGGRLRTREAIGGKLTTQQAIGGRLTAQEAIGGKVVTREGVGGRLRSRGAVGGRFTTRTP